MRPLLVVSLGLFVSMMACGGRNTPEPRATPTPVRLGDLPSLPFQLAQSSAGFQRLFEGAREALEEEMPEPVVTNEPAYRRYIDDSLLDWLDRRGSSIRAAETRVRSLADSPDEEIAVAHAIVAYLNERTAEDVLGAPVPNEATDPERARVLRSAWRESMTPLLESARTHFASCARTLSLASPELAQWKRRCDDETPEAERRASSALPSGETAEPPGDAESPAETPAERHRPRLGPDGLPE